MIRYRKARAHTGSSDPEQVKRWAKEFPDCNWGIAGWIFSAAAGPLLLMSLGLSL